jgi:hypothetical protein
MLFAADGTASTLMRASLALPGQCGSRVRRAWLLQFRNSTAARHLLRYCGVLSSHSALRRK